MHGGPARLLALVAALLLAGCSGGGGEAGGDRGDGLSEGSGVGVGTGIPMPTWAVGDAWTYVFDGEPATYVVTGETSSDWIMETDSAERAFSDQRDDISRLGPQRKADLAGSQGQDRVEFFRWPLEAGKSWATRWDGLDVEVRVVEVDGAAGRARLEAYEVAPDPPRETPLYRYTYDGAAGWFGDLQRYGPDGAALVDLQLTAAVHDWTGTLVHWTLATVIEDSGNDPAKPPTAGGPFEVAAGTTDIWAEYSFACGGNGGFAVAVLPANPGLAGQQSYTDNGQCTEVDAAGVIVDGPHPGTWTFAVSAGGQTIDYAYAILLRTRQDVAFPA